MKYNKLLCHCSMTKNVKGTNYISTSKVWEKYHFMIPEIRDRHFSQSIGEMQVVDFFFFFWAIPLLLFYLKSDRVSDSIAWAIIVLIGESDIRARPNGNQNIMCHQKRSSRTCTKREEEEFALQQTEILCQPLMISLTGVSVKEKIRLIRKCCV